jgi:hypothetical protein
MSDTLPGIAPLPRIPCPYCNGDGSRRARDPLSNCVAVTQCIACSGSGDVPTATAKIPPMSPETRAEDQQELLEGHGTGLRRWIL